MNSVAYTDRWSIIDAVAGATGGESSLPQADNTPYAHGSLNEVSFASAGEQARPSIFRLAERTVPDVGKVVPSVERPAAIFGARPVPVSVPTMPAPKLKSQPLASSSAHDPFAAGPVPVTPSRGVFGMKEPVPAVPDMPFAPGEAEIEAALGLSASADALKQPPPLPSSRQAPQPQTFQPTMADQQPAAPRSAAGPVFASRQVNRAEAPLLQKIQPHAAQPDRIQFPETASASLYKSGPLPAGPATVAAPVVSRNLFRKVNAPQVASSPEVNSLHQLFMRIAEGT